METKLSTAQSSFLTGAFSIKSAEGNAEVKDLVIEGFANKAVVDRANEYIDPEGWKLDNFMKHPIIFFNHDRNEPIGRATAVKKGPEGLYVKVKLSSSNQGAIPKVRDLVKEGVLKTFSVGFSKLDEAVNEKGVNVIKGAELLEVSIVTLPENQDSIFQVTTKSLAQKPYHKVREEILKSKGAWVAGAVHNHIYNLQKETPDFNRDAALETVAETAGVSLDELKDILAGNVTPVPEIVLSAFSKVLGMDEKVLRELDAGDQPVANNAAEDQPVEVTPQREAAPPAEEEKAAEQPAIESPAPSTSINPSKDAATQGSDPVLSTMMQTNILLGALINEVQKLSAKFDGMSAYQDQNQNVDDTQAVTTLSAQENSTKVVVDDRVKEAKKLDDINEYLENLDVRLKKLSGISAA